MARGARLCSPVANTHEDATLPTTDPDPTQPRTGEPDPKHRSRDVTDGYEKAPARAMLRAVGMTDEDFGKPTPMFKIKAIPTRANDFEASIGSSMARD